MVVVIELLILLIDVVLVAILLLAVVSPVFNVLIDIVLVAIFAFAVVSAGNIGSCVSVKTPYILKLSKLFKYNKSFTFSDALGTIILVDWVT